jgi:membrane protease YdiL (CAAX protease family)
VIRTWLNPPRPAFPEPVTDRRERRGIVVELVIVSAITLGLSGLRSLLSLVDSLLREERLADQAVALNVPQATNQVLDFIRQLLSATQLFAWGALGLYLEVLVVGYLITRLRQLGLGENASLLVSSVLRGSYHLYQGFGGFLGNVVMGLVFGRVWQRTNRLWPLVLAHFLIDFVAFVGYAILRGRVSWLP